MHSMRVLRLLCLGAVAFMAASAVDAYAAEPAFCGTQGGCATVAASDWGRRLGQVLPVFGLVTYTAIFATSLVNLRRVRRVGLYLALLGGVGALLLLGLQAWVIGAFCSVCVGADGFALATAVMALITLRDDYVAPSSWPLAAWAALYVLAAGTLPAYAVSRPEPVPDAIRALQLPGRINVIEFSDFECPYCKALHPVLDAALQPYAERVHFQRLSYPLNTHRFALPAAVSYLCAMQQGRGEAMADALFAAAELTPEAREAAARAAGLDLQAYARCAKDSDSFAEVARQRKLVAEIGMRGLPTVWIGDQVLVGFDRDAGTAPYEAALRAAEQGQRETFASWPWLWMGVVALALVTLANRAEQRRKQA